MAVTVALYTFNKANNSTALPGADLASLQTSGVFKANADILSPTIGFDFGSSSVNPTAYNYAYISDFSRYYFIRNWVYSGRLWYAEMAVDVLGTYKIAIGGSSQYVLRAAGAYNGRIQDNYYPAMSQPTITINNTANSYYAGAIGSGSYVLGIINSTSNNAAGMVSYYAMTSAQLGSLKSALMSSPDWTDVDDISGNLLRTYFNPLDYIVSVMWFPFSLSSQGSAVTSIQLGWWSFSVSAIYLTSTVYTIQSQSITIPKHPQAESRGAYLNEAPYTSYTAYIYPFGAFPVDAGLLQIFTNVSFDIVTDLPTGVGYLYLYAGSNRGNRILTTESMVGVNIPVAQITTDILGATVSAVQGISNIAQGFTTYSGGMGLITETATDVLNTVSTLAGTIGNVASSLQPKLMTKGSAGSISAYTNVAATRMGYLMGEFYPVVSADDDHVGRPLCESRTLNTLSGFIACQNPEINFGGTATERDMIARYLTGGFYME